MVLGILILSVEYAIVDSASAAFEACQVKRVKKRSNLLRLVGNLSLPVAV